MIIDTREEQQLIIERDTGIGYNKKEIRSYEVSLWTLQDSFITVLKWSDIEQPGRIQEPRMKLNIDGTESFTFSIPMYIRKDGALIENPNWYTVKDKQLLQNMRKIKVVFNKGNSNEHVFEFMITEVTEEHSDDALTCKVTCEGLAFNELGKIGYQYTLSPEEFYQNIEEWFELQIGDKPKQNIDYWCSQIDLEKVPENEAQCDSRTWYYQVCMNWSGYQYGVARDSSVVYEEAYASEWNADLQPTKIVEYREKERPVSAEKSNLYNITQSIAEAFGVFCRYEYLHNANQQITGRRIIFYNNFFAEESGMITFNYPYYTNKISRKIDSSNLTTKLYVSDVETQDSYEGVYSIMNAEANVSQENYLLNFDYMLENGAISQDQYDEILPYLKKMRQLNQDIIRLQANRDAYEQEIPKLKASIAVCDKNVSTAGTEIERNSQLRIALGQRTGDGTIPVTAARPDQTVVVNAGNGKGYIKLDSTNKGILPGTIKIYSRYNSTNGTFNDNYEIKNFDIEKDEYGYATMLTNVPYDTNQSSVVYLIYNYNPFLYYDAVLEILEKAQGENEEKQKELEERLGKQNSIGEGISGLYLLQTQTINTIKEKVEEQKKVRKTFERMMGPALREGYWQPDDYADYGDEYEVNLSIPSTVSSNGLDTNTGKDLIVGWDLTLFDDEDKLSYQVGINTSDIEYYPCINLSSVLSNTNFINSGHDITDFSFIFMNNQIESLSGSEPYRIKNLQIYKIGSQAILRYALYNNQITPILVLVGAKKLTNQQLRWLYGDSQHPQSSYSRPALAIIDNTQDSAGHYIVDYTNTSKYFSLAGASYWINNINNQDVHASISAQPIELRLKCSSLDMKTDASTLAIKYKYGDGADDQILLKPFEHYYVNIYNNFDRNPNIEEDAYRVEQYITIKPEVLMRHDREGTLIVDYIISNACLAIYQDALQVLKENATPKVSYEISPTILDTNLSNHLYDTLAQIVMINDTDLKLVNTFGYISELELDLDEISKDSIVIQNYTSKFEDLFSSIVASTESLKRAQGAMSAAAGGNVALSPTGFTESLDENVNILQAYLDSYFDGSDVVEKKLQSLFTEASQILGDASQSIHYAHVLTEENASILGEFVSNASDMLSTKVYTGKNKPLNFKIGDKWTYTEDGVTYTYVAISNSEDVDGTGTTGFTRTYDGSLAQITGAALNVDAVSGKVAITAENEISLETGGNVRIAANENVYIHGNQTIDISGTTINLTTNVDTSDKGAAATSGINIMSTGYNSNGYASTGIARVNINPTKILMAGSEVEILTSKDSTTSALQLNNQGIKLFSTGEINLFSGDKDHQNAVGGSVEINNQHIFLAYTSDTNGTNAANVELNNKGIILAVGNANSQANKNIGSESGLTGAKITADSIGLSVGSGTNRSAFLMNANGFTIGAGAFDVSSNSGQGNTGSYVKISGTGIELGTTSHLYINTNNFKLQTRAERTALAVGTNLNGVSADTVNPSTITDEGKFNTTSANPPKVNFLVNDNGAYVNGYIYATGGRFIGDVYANSFQLTGKTIPAIAQEEIQTAINNGTFKIDGLSQGLQWNGTTYKVALTSTEGLLIGANAQGTVTGQGGITIVTAANGSSYASVKIDSEKIQFQTDANNYVSMNSAGIVLMGKSIKIYQAGQSQAAFSIDKDCLHFSHIDNTDPDNPVENFVDISNSGIKMRGSRIQINDQYVYGADNLFYTADDALAAQTRADLVSSGYHGPFIWIKPDAGRQTAYGAADNQYYNAGVWAARAIAAGMNPFSGQTATTATYAIDVHCGLHVDFDNRDWTGNGSQIRKIYLSAYADGSSSVSADSTSYIELSTQDRNKTGAVGDFHTVAAGSSQSVRDLVSASTIYATIPSEYCASFNNVEIIISLLSGDGTVEGTLCTVYHYML